MESKREDKSDFKSESAKRGSCKDADEDFVDESLFSDDKPSDSKEQDDEIVSSDTPRVDILELDISPSELVDISSGLSLNIKFELDRDVVAGYWSVQFLVDSCYSRIIRILGETQVDDYTEGENEMHFEVPSIDVEGIEPSALTNAGLLMAKFMANGVEVMSVNMVSAMCPRLLATFQLRPYIHAKRFECYRLCKFSKRMADSSERS